MNAFINKNLVKKLSFLAVVLSLSFTACSKKKRDDGGDTAGDASAMQATDLSAGGGARIPELGSIYFEYDSFVLTSRSKGDLNKHVEWLNTNSSRNIQVEGHCDERGTTEYNLALGERRAASVKDYLVSKGISAGRISTISYGEERPATAGSDESAWSQNRRAEFANQ